MPHSKFINRAVHIHGYLLFKMRFLSFSHNLPINNKATKKENRKHFLCKIASFLAEQRMIDSLMLISIMIY